LVVDSISQPVPPAIDQISSADLLIGLLVDLNPDELAAAREDLRTLPGSPKIVVLQNQPPPPPSPPAGLAPTEDADSSILILPWPPQTSGAQATPVASFAAAYESIFAAGAKLDVRACCMVASKFETPSPGWITQLTRPLLEQNFDLVAPCYARRKFEGLLNNSIVGPLTRSLYGKRIQNPLGPDLGVSRRLLQQSIEEDNDTAPAGNGMNLLARLAPLACGDNLRICQTYLGSRAYPPLDWTNVSSLLTDILGPIFVAMEKNAARWQQTRNSTSIATLNEPPTLVDHAAGAIEIARLINSFQLGLRDLQEIWGLVLPPATLFELRRISPDQFRIPDELWVRIVYDFALAHRLRTINRAHLLPSLTPLYLGWVASYAREIENADAATLDRRLERLSLAYERGKPYLISRWRWPDRFNP
jgi:hypothetical protein